MPFLLSAPTAGFRRQVLFGARRIGFTLAILSALCTASLPAAEPVASASERGEAYYHFALGHLYHQFAQQYGRREYVERAAKEYAAALEADPDSQVIRIEMVNLYAVAGRLSKAVEIAEGMLEEEPENLEVHRLLGSIYRSYATRDQQGVNAELLAKAIQQFERVVEIEPENAENHTQLGLLYRSAQQPEKAEATLQRALELDPGQADAQVDLAYLLLESGKFREAIDVLEGIVAESGGDRRSMNALAEAYEQVGRFRDAAATYEKIVAQGGNTLQARQRFADNLFLSRQFGRAIEQYRTLTGLDSDNTTYHLRISQIERERGDFAKAWESLERARRIDPDSIQVQFDAINLLEREGRIEEAAEQTSQLLESTRKAEYAPNERRRRTMLLERLGLLQRELESTEQAIETFREIAEVDPQFKPRVHVHVIETWRQERNYARAEAEARKAVDEFDDNPMLANLLAGILADRGRTKDAIKVIQRLGKGVDSDFDMLLTMARIYEKGRQFDKAEERIERASALAETDDQSVAVLFAYGSLYERAKEYEKSEAKFRELLKLDPENAGALNYLGYMFADRSVNLEEAHGLIQRALDQEPNNGAYLDSLGWVYYRQDKLDLAVKFLERSLEQHGDDPVIHTHLGDAYFKQGRVSEAKRHWSRGLEEWNRSPPADRDSAEVESLRRKLAELDLSMADGADGKKKSPVKR